MLPRLFVSFGSTISVILHVDAETGLEDGVGGIDRRTTAFYDGVKERW